MKSCCDEYCSTYGCKQGRNCPVRIELYKQMSNQRIYTIIAVLLTIFWAAVFAGVFTFMQPKKIDCSLAEISPDYTQKMKYQCRKVRT